VRVATAVVCGLVTATAFDIWFSLSVASWFGAIVLDCSRAAPRARASSPLMRRCPRPGHRMNVLSSLRFDSAGSAYDEGLRANECRLIDLRGSQFGN